MKIHTKKNVSKSGYNKRNGISCWTVFVYILTHESKCSLCQKSLALSPSVVKIGSS